MQPNNKTLILSEKDIIATLNHFGIDTIMDELVSRIEQAVNDYDPKKIHVPIRDGFHYDIPNTGLVEWMPVYQNGSDVVIKVVGYHPHNPSKYDLPTIISTISTYDTATGHLKSLMDGVLLTALRTGASSAVATKLLAHPESKVLGLIGCGAQAVTQLHALSRYFAFDTVLIYDTDEDTLSSFENRVSSLGLNCNIITKNIEGVIEGSDIVCTATSIDVNAGPLFDGVTTLPHIHINAVGSDFPGKTELPLSLLKTSKVVPDFHAQAIKEGECQQLNEEDIYDDWVKILQNKNKYTALQYQSTVFDSTGWALEDLVVSALFTEYATKIGVGSYLEIENLSNDVKNPYAFITTPALESFAEKSS